MQVKEQSQAVIMIVMVSELQETMQLSFLTEPTYKMKNSQKIGHNVLYQQPNLLV